MHAENQNTLQFNGSYLFPSLPVSLTFFLLLCLDYDSSFVKMLSQTHQVALKTNKKHLS